MPLMFRSSSTKPSHLAIMLLVHLCWKSLLTFRILRCILTRLVLLVFLLLLPPFVFLCRLLLARFNLRWYTLRMRGFYNLTIAHGSVGLQAKVNADDILVLDYWRLRFDFNIHGTVPLVATLLHRDMRPATAVQRAPAGQRSACAPATDQLLIGQISADTRPHTVDVGVFVAISFL